MHEESIHYIQGKDTFHGYLVYDSAIKTKRPAILIAHAWKGLDEFAKTKARELAKLGYLAFAADVYGHGKVANSNEEAEALMLPLFINRKLLRDRICAAYDTMAKHKMTDPAKMGAIGFCFGGLTVIELFRSGANLQGVISFHGLLGDTLGKNKAITVPLSKHIKGSILILHGHDDPFVNGADVETFQKEMTSAKVDWQMHIYGQTVHAFTNPDANDIGSGMVFNAKANQRAWQSLRDFFEEVMQQQENI